MVSADPPLSSDAADDAPSQWRWAAAIFLAAFALLLASHPARNSILWAHLAAGRDLALAELPLQRSWLLNVVLYWLYQAGGGVGVVVVKSLLAAALGLIMYDLCRQRGGGWQVAVFCAALTLLAVGTRLLVQPVTASYLFLAVALWLLRPRARGNPPIFPPPWPLLVLFVLWANSDVWFTAGLVIVALWWLGQAFDALASGEKSRRSPLLQWPLAVGLLAAVCVINPLHVRAFSLPAELGWLSGAASGRVLSPFSSAYFTSIGANPAGLAVFPLLGLGLLSFMLNVRGWRWQRFLPWVALAAVSYFDARAVPFFALVAGPVLAWNASEFFACFEDAWFARPLWTLRLFVNSLIVTLALAALVCAWPGWLQAPPYEPRRWAIDLPTPFLRAADAARRWQQQGELPAGSRFLHVTAETAHAFNWGCPEVRGGTDAQLAAALRGQAGATFDLPRQMRAGGFDHVVVAGPDRNNLAATLGRLSFDPDQWPLLYLEGGVAIFGWRDPARKGEADPFAGRILDLNRLAFAPGGQQHAPDRGPDIGPERRPQLDVFIRAGPPPPSDRDEAMMFAVFAESLRARAPERRLSEWEAGQIAGLVGAAAAWTPAGSLPDAAIRLTLFRPPPQDPDRRLPLAGAAEALRMRAWMRQDDTSPALLMLTIRAARRAAAANPDDAQTYQLLGDAYLRLVHATRERAWAERMTELGQLRLAQASAALNRAIALQPDLAQAHLSLGGVYRDLGYLDLAVHHLRTYLRLARAAGPPPGVDPLAFRAQADRFEEDLITLSQTVSDRLQTYSKESANQRIFTRASLAKEKGLAQVALDELLASDVAAFGFPGLVMELELLLGTGRARNVRDWTDPEQKPGVGLGYHWLRAQATASLGDYAEAQSECLDLAAALTPEEEAGSTSQQLIAGLVARSILEAMPTWGGLPPFLAQANVRAEILSRILARGRALRRQADVHTLRGVLALEQGQTAEAEAAFRQALTMWKSGLDFNGRPVAQGYLALIESAK